MYLHRFLLIEIFYAPAFRGEFGLKLTAGFVKPRMQKAGTKDPLLFSPPVSFKGVPALLNPRICGEFWWE